MESINISLPKHIRNNISITENTYYKMGGIARYFALPKNSKEVQQTLYFCKKNLLPCAILGSGSNSIYADGFFDGLILSLEKLSSWHWESSDYLFVEAGVTNTEVAEICAAENRAGASWMYRMPGQIGATVRMNARCYGGEISQITKEILTINRDGEFITYNNADIFQGYKKTLLMASPHIVVGVRLFFPNVSEAEDLLQHMHECEADRHSKQHFYLPSCGSTFKNNYDVGSPSGKIFDELGLKGKQIGEAVVSEFHANFIWNCGHAKTDDMLNLSAFMRQEAKRVMNADLELEVQPVGAFSQKLFDKCGMDKLGPAYPHLKKEDEKWVGLFYFPQEHINNKIEFPKIIFSSPFFEYSQSSFSGETQIAVNLIQLNTLDQARKNPKNPFLKWETKYFDLPDKLFPLCPQEKAGYLDNLWNYSVSEIFFADVNKPSRYLEFEMTPQQNWIAIKFSDVRKRSIGIFKPNVLTFVENNMFGIYFSFEDISYALGNENSLFMQCALSLGNGRYFLAPYWKETKNGTPDFHQPGKYWRLNFSRTD